jgi:DNA (cytosine-5)-methyltransferase 1
MEQDDSRITLKLATAADLSELSGEELTDLYTPDTWTLIEDHGRAFPFWGIAQSGKFFGADLQTFNEKLPPVPLQAVLQTDAPREFDFTETTLKWVSDNTPVNRFVQGVEILSNQSGGARMGYTIFGINGVAPTLTSTTSRHYERYKIGNRYRRLTNIEYARIQGFPDDYCQVISVYDQYALFGSAVPPRMAKWVMERIELPGVTPTSVRSKARQRTLFEHAYQRCATGDLAGQVGRDDPAGQRGSERARALPH